MATLTVCSPLCSDRENALTAFATGSPTEVRLSGPLCLLCFYAARSRLRLASHYLCFCFKVL